MNNDLAGQTVVMSGGSRGIGLAIALNAARLGANIVLIAKTDKPDPRLDGTVHTAVDKIRAAGGQGIAVVGDVRNSDDVARAVAVAVSEFGGIDACINNASAISLMGSEEMQLKRFDLLQEVNVRGTWLLTTACLPHLFASQNPNIVTLSPPINLSAHWLGRYPAYMASKYGMSLLTLAWAEEFRERSVSANAVWPATLIATAAVQNVVGGDEAMARARSPQIMADAVVDLLLRPRGEVSGNCFLDEDILREAGVKDFSIYGGGADPEKDLFVD